MVKRINAPAEHISRFGEGKLASTRIKRCNVCMRYHPLFLFSENKRNMDGLSSFCKKCRPKRKSANKNYYEENPAYFSLLAKARYLEKKAEKKIHQKDYDGYEILVKAKRFRKHAGKPTR